MAGPIHVYALRAHLIDELLPLWYERGLDSARRGFHNRLTPELAPAPDDYKRLLVQARQVYAFSRGAELGAGPWALEAAQAAFEFLGARFWDAGRGGWHRTVSLDGEPLDRRTGPLRLGDHRHNLLRYPLDRVSSRRQGHGST